MTAIALRIGRRTFRSLRRHRNYRLFFGGQVVSLVGTWMQNIALAWLVIEMSGSRRSRSARSPSAGSSRSSRSAWSPA